MDKLAKARKKLLFYLIVSYPIALGALFLLFHFAQKGGKITTGTFLILFCYLFYATFGFMAHQWGSFKRILLGFFLVVAPLMGFGAYIAITKFPLNRWYSFIGVAIMALAMAFFPYFTLEIFEKKKSKDIGVAV